MSLRVLHFTAVLVCLTSSVVQCQQAKTATGVSIIQPGAPGTSNKTLSKDAATASEALKSPSKADVDFMQGMIMHHNQAVEMTELLKTRTKDPAVRELGDKIDVSQTDEMRWMKQWLTDRGFSTEMPAMDMSNMKGMDMDMPPMPGMLTKAQMETLRKAKGAQFDHLFLTGMIQHHTGALGMVDELYKTQGAGHDPQLFDFTADVQVTQQGEIDGMKAMLAKEK